MEPRSLQRLRKRQRSGGKTRQLYRGQIIIGMLRMKSDLGRRSFIDSNNVTSEGIGFFKCFMCREADFNICILLRVEGV